MADLLREAPLGHAIRWFSNNKLLQYPEERTDFVLPLQYVTQLNSEKAAGPFRSSTRTLTSPPSPRVSLSNGDLIDKDVENLGLSQTKSRLDTAPNSSERLG